MTIGFITTSRADFGIYYPLLQLIKKSKRHKYIIFAGGMHTAKRFGYSYKYIEDAGFIVHEKLDTMLEDDSPLGISLSMGCTLTEYAKVWERYKSKLDIVFVIADRFEMLAAASSLIPYNIKLAHLHGGESTLGLIDEKCRHAISAISDIHFTSNARYSMRVKSIAGNNKHIYTVGALGIDNIKQLPLYTKEEFLSLFDFDISQPYILTTYHPETINLGTNKKNIKQFIRALKAMPERILCTLPNADTEGMTVRNLLLEFEQNAPQKIKCYENLGQRGYLTALKHSVMMAGNSSSGIIEAASYHKPVINVGDRQKGRLCGKNVFHSTAQFENIIKQYHLAKKAVGKKFTNPYGDGKTAPRVLSILERAL